MANFAPMLDYLVIGLGLSGISFCETLERHGKSFMVLNDHSQNSSVIAAGLYNPVILNRFTLAWQAREQLQVALPLYKGLEKKLGVPFDQKIPVLRRFASVAEQNLWFQAADTRSLEPFLAPRVTASHNPNIDAPYGYGEVLGTGRIDTRVLLEQYSGYLMESGRLLRETCLFSELVPRPDHIQYRSLKARQVVFACGFGLKQNPWFSYLPLNGTKGELLIIKSPALQESRVVKSSVFIIPQGDDHYSVGATYSRGDKTNTPTGGARAELLTKLGSIVRCAYEVVLHHAGIRPTVADRRPLVGRHPEHKNMYVLNGMGSRGVMVAPYAAQQLYALIEHQQTVHPGMDIARFVKKCTGR